MSLTKWQQSIFDNCHAACWYHNLPRDGIAGKQSVTFPNGSTTVENISSKCHVFVSQLRTLKCFDWSLISVNFYATIRSKFHNVQLILTYLRQIAMLDAVLTVVLVFLFSVTIPPESGQCQAITNRICQQIGYNSSGTTFPNFVGHTTQVSYRATPTRLYLTDRWLCIIVCNWVWDRGTPTIITYQRNLFKENMSGLSCYPLHKGVGPAHSCDCGFLPNSLKANSRWTRE